MYLVIYLNYKQLKYVFLDIFMNHKYSLSLYSLFFFFDSYYVFLKQRN